MGRDRSALARAALEDVFADFPQSDVPVIEIAPADPFSDDMPDELRVYRGRVPVTLSTRIELRGYPNANVFMKKMEAAWSLNWYSVDGAAAVARLADSWSFTVNEEGVTEVIDPRRRVRALSKIAGEQQSFLRVLPRYYIGGSRGFVFRGGDETLWELGVRDREEAEVSIHWVECDGSREAIESEKSKLLLWLDERYPNHRDPFAYWSDCTARGR